MNTRRSDWTFKLVACAGEQFLLSMPRGRSSWALPGGSLAEGESFADVAARLGVELEGLLRVERCEDRTAFIFTGKLPEEREGASLFSLQDLNDLEIPREDDLEISEFLVRKDQVFPLSMLALD